MHLKKAPSQLLQRACLSHLHLPVMNLSLDNVFRHMGRVMGDPLHREACVWMGEDRKRCGNIVKKEDRVKGAICLQALREIPSSYSTTHQLAMGGTFLLCSHCRSHRYRPRKWAESVIRSLDKRTDQAKINPALHPVSCNASGKQQTWPLSLSMEINGAPGCR